MNRHFAMPLQLKIDITQSMYVLLTLNRTPNANADKRL